MNLTANTVGPEEPVFRAPQVVIWLLGAMVAVYGIMALLPRDAFERVLVNFAFIPAQLSVVSLDRLTWSLDSAQSFWPLVTYAFLHADLTHLALNGVWFLAFATPVTRRVGAWPMVALLLVATIAAALVHWSVNTDSIIPMVGASGGISGLMGAAFRFMFLDPQGNLGRPGGRLPLLHPRILMLAGVWSVLNVIMGVLGTGLLGESGQMIAWEAHLGGFFAGLVLFPLFDWRTPRPTLTIRAGTLI